MHPSVAHSTSLRAVDFLQSNTAPGTLGRLCSPALADTSTARFTSSLGSPIALTLISSYYKKHFHRLQSQSKGESRFQLSLPHSHFTTVRRKVISCHIQAAQSSTMAPTVPTRELYIGGKWVAPAKNDRIPVVNPATEETIGTIPAGGPEDVDAAVRAARSAYARNRGRDWPKTTGAYRAKFLRAIAAKVVERKLELAQLESLDMGKPLDESEWDLDDVAGCFEYYAGLAEGLDAKQDAPLALPMDTFKCSIRKEALGVVALITPWLY
eukprot:jgi/Mesen1/6851/ME000351S05969